MERFSSPEAACRSLALEIAALVREKPDARLGLPTGRTPIPLYRELARLHREEGLSFARACSFNLDEYLGLAADDARSFRAFMREHFFAQVDFEPRNVHFPNVAGEPEREARAYAQELRAAGGLDLALLGLGRNGHVGFNEPGSGRDSSARVVELADQTRADAAVAFGGLANVPVRAITLGLAEILEARAIRMLAFGAAKSEVVRRMLLEPASQACPASLLRGHADLALLLDEGASTGLPR
ncbi:MAG: glucosamine-6-phosphate deaminase [Planctomycetes bacterium]|nr:glucosamine-6-phosphate deaminase [Planctomycetota bacterium]